MLPINRSMRAIPVESQQERGQGCTRMYADEENGIATTVAARATRKRMAWLAPDSIHGRAGGERRLADLETASAGGKDFSGIQAVFGIEKQFQRSDGVECFGREEFGHELVLFHPDAVLAGDGAAVLDAEREDLLARRARLFDLAGLARVEEDYGVHVAIAGMEDIADGEAVFARDLADEMQGGGDHGAGDDAILHVVGGADAAHGAEGVLAPLPEQLALLGGLRDAELARAADAAGLADLLDLLLDGLANA